MTDWFGTPIDARDAMESDRRALSALLAVLEPDDWARPTAAAPWTVRDVVAHVVADDLNRLSRGRDGWTAGGPEPGEPLPGFLHRINDEWVRATVRLSPAVLRELLDLTTGRVLEFWRAADMDALGEPVTWAGPDPAPVWLDQARDFTEYWTHHRQIRDATGHPGPSGPDDRTPIALDTFLRAMPHTLSTIPRPDGTTLTVRVPDAAWTWRCTDGTWWPAAPPPGPAVCAGGPAPASGGPAFGRDDRPGPSGTVLTFPDPGTLWRLCVRMIDPAEARTRVHVTGDEELADRALGIVSIIR